MMQKLINKQNKDEKSKKLQSDLKELETQQASVQRDKAEVELAKLHPDFNDIREDEKFHEWVAKQDSTIQGWLYDNTSNKTDILLPSKS